MNAVDSSIKRDFFTETVLGDLEVNLCDLMSINIEFSNFVMTKFREISCKINFCFQNH